MQVNILDKIVQSYLPLIISFAGLIASIIIAGATIRLTNRLDEKNEQFQKELSSRDMRIQSREVFLDIYNAYFEAYAQVLQADDIADVFTSTQSYMKWAQEIELSLKNLDIAYNKCNLIIEDSELSQTLKQARDAFADIYCQIHYYINTSIPEITIRTAWTEISSSHNIEIGDYYSLFINPVIKSQFIQLCKNPYTDNIKEAMEAYCKIVKTNSFDAVFRRHIQIDEWATTNK